VRRRDLLALIGSAVTLRPLATIAHQKAMPVIGFLASGSRISLAGFIAAFNRGLSETGYVEGQNVSIEYRLIEGGYDQVPALMADLIDRKVDVIAVIGTPTARLAKSTTSVIPIAFVIGDDPVASGLVASLSRPGGNLTGISTLNIELHPKRLELLSELVPQVKAVALLVNPKGPQTERIIRQAQETVRVMSLQLHVLEASTESEIDGAFATLDQLHIGALVSSSDPFFTSRREQLVALAARSAVPAIYQWREFVEMGGLISYGPSLSTAYRELGIYAGRILRGAKPADLPVQQSVKVEMIVNLKTATALGLTVPQSILARADEVIE
jgi:putative tryptophan/tyrosine transport system substrate-binding protein